MPNWSRTVFATMFFVIKLTDSEFRYKEEDFAFVETLGSSLRIKCFAFVSNHVDFDFAARHLSRFFKGSTYAVRIDSSKLDAALGRNLCGKYGMFITRESDLNQALRKVSGSIILTFVETLEAVENVYVPMSTELFVAEGAPGGVNLSRAFHLKSEERLRVENVGVWRKGGKTADLASLQRNRINFNRSEIKMIYLHTDEHCKNVTAKHVLDLMECYHKDIIRIMADKWNFTINEIECLEKQHPYNYPNATLSVMFTTLTRREVDVSAGSYIVSVARLDEFDFSWPSFDIRSMMYIQLKNSKSNWRVYLRPISSFLWKVVFCWILGTGILIQVFEEIRSKNYSSKFFLVVRVVKSIYSSLQVFCNQGIGEMPVWVSSRTVYFMTFLFSVLLYEAYSAVLVSSLMNVVPVIPFTDIIEFFMDGSYKILTKQTGFNNYYIEQMSLQLKGRLNPFMLKRGERPLTVDEAIVKLCSEKNLGYMEFRENIVQHELPCKITEIPKPMLHRNVGIGLPKNSTLMKIMNKELTVLRSAGIIHRMKKGFFTYTKLQQKDMSDDEYIPVSLDHVVSTFIIIGGGHVFSTVILLLEILLDATIKFCAPRYRRMFRLPSKREKLEKKYAKGLKMILGWMSIRSRWSSGTDRHMSGGFE